MDKMIISTEKAPQAIGPYSQAITTGSMVFISGQLPIEPNSGTLITDDIQAETRQALTNLREILVGAGSGLDRVVKTTLFITDMKKFPQINDVYKEFFHSHPPARSCVEVSSLPKGANLEIEAIAILKK